MLDSRRFVWDKINVEKLAFHDIELYEVEEVSSIPKRDTWRASKDMTAARPILEPMSDVKPYREVERILVTRAEDIPDFSQMTREEEAEWWETHDLADHLMESGEEIDAEVYEALGVPGPAKRRR